MAHNPVDQLQYEAANAADDGSSDSAASPGYSRMFSPSDHLADESPLSKLMVWPPHTDGPDHNCGIVRPHLFGDELHSTQWLKEFVQEAFSELQSSELQQKQRTFVESCLEVVAERFMHTKWSLCTESWLEVEMAAKQDLRNDMVRALQEICQCAAEGHFDYRFIAFRQLAKPTELTILYWNNGAAALGTSACSCLHKPINHGRALLKAKQHFGLRINPKWKLLPHVIVVCEAHTQELIDYIEKSNYRLFAGSARSARQDVAVFVHKSLCSHIEAHRGERRWYAIDVRVAPSNPILCISGVHLHHVGKKRVDDYQQFQGYALSDKVKYISVGDFNGAPFIRSHPLDDVVSNLPTERLNVIGESTKCMDGGRHHSLSVRVDLCVPLPIVIP